MGSGNFENVLEAVRTATEAMVYRRSEADEKAGEAIDLVEKSLVAALGGEVLRGMSDLGDRVFGMRVSIDGSLSAKLPANGSAHLVLNHHGMLVLASMHGAGTSFVQRPPRAMLRASILVPYMRAVREACALHVRAADRRAAEFGKISDLAGRIGAVVAGTI